MRFMCKVTTEAMGIIIGSHGLYYWNRTPYEGHRAKVSPILVMPRGNLIFTLCK